VRFPEQFERKLADHAWTCPPRGPLDRAEFEAVAGPMDGLGEPHRLLHSVLAKSGAVPFRELAIQCRIGPAAAAKLIADLAGKGLVRDVSENAEVRREVWKHECMTAIGHFADESLTRLGLRAAVKGEGIRDSALCMRYLKSAGFLEAMGHGASPKYRIPSGEMAVAERMDDAVEAETGSLPSP